VHFRQGGAALALQIPAIQQFGSCLMQLNRASEAVPVFQDLMLRQPADEHARYNLAVVQFTAKDYSEAIKTVQPLLVGVSTDSDALDLASAAYEETGDTPRAVALLRQAILANPKKVKYYVDFAALSVKHDSYQVGIDIINAGITQNPNNPALHIARGILFIQKGQYPEGRADFETADRLDPSQASASAAEGLAMMQQANLDEALATVDTQLKRHSDDPFLHYLKAEILEQRGAVVGTTDFKQALRDLAEAVRLAPDFLLAHDLLGNIYLKSGQTEKAIEQCRIVLRSDPNDQTALYHLLLALRKSGDPKGEGPGIVRQLAALREESQNEQSSATRYKLYEPDKPVAGPPTN
jgi:tetratricopeptide (TPR) repeat protein